ncbi:MAG: glycoside hydrolase family 13 protein [Spirochaetaceae bacterium]
MKREAVLHIANMLDAYGLSDNRVVIRLRTAKDDCRAVRLFYVDKYLFERTGTYHDTGMNKVASCDLFDYYEAEISFRFISMQYFFSLEQGDQSLFYGKDTFQNTMPVSIGAMYNFPVLAESGELAVPPWAQDAIAYQIFPERFSRDNDNASEAGQDDWYGPIAHRSFLGGTIRGIIDKLDYLADLGINLIYLNPIFPSRSNHKYDTRDYFDIDPAFGTKDDFRDLVNACHDRGMRIILDGVFNHSGKDFFAFQDVLEKGETSEYADWFVCDSFPLDPQITHGPQLQYKSFGYFHAMPKFNHANPAVIDYICKVGCYWVEEFGIDGWRMDVADEVPFDVWRTFRKRVHKVNPNVLLLAEIWYDSRPWLQGDQFDSVMNYLFFDAVIDFVAEKSIQASEFSHRLGFIRGLYKKPVFDVLWNLIDSHDTPRFLHRAQEDTLKLEMAALLQMTFPGIPCVYYGDELAMTGGADPDCRRGMRWNRIESHGHIRSYYKRLIQARKNIPALRYGDFVQGQTDDTANVCIFRRIYGEEECVIILNNGTAPYTHETDRSARNVLAETAATVSHTVAAGSSAILQLV